MADRSGMGTSRSAAPFNPARQNCDNGRSGGKAVEQTIAPTKAR
jgi:hypothetical protein